MIKQVLYKLVLVLMRIIRSGLIICVTAFLIGVMIFGNWEIIQAIPMIVPFLLYAVLVYHIGYGLNLKNIICDILYFIVFAYRGLYFLGSVIDASKQSLNDGGLNFCAGFFYVFTVTGMAVYFSEVIFRNQKRVKELGHKDMSDKMNWKGIFGQIFKQPQSIFSAIVKSYFMIVIAVFLAIAGAEFVNFNIRLLPIMYGLLFSLCLLPAIIFYHSSRSLKLKWWICDTSYFVGVIIGELPFLLFILKDFFITGEFSLSSQFSNLRAWGISVVVFCGVFVYMAEVYFRNRAILKSLERK